MSNEKCKNEMIAEWVGFKERFTPGDLSNWWEFDGYPYAQCPDFMNSETDCFQWIVPRLRERGCGVDITVGRTGAFINLWDLDERDGDSKPAMAIGVDTNVATALCVAVLELMRTEWADRLSRP